jgi:2',3'-cyclic-nucleotide 2'-phosphodiesterase (5'-nucleotidase family)
MSSRKKFRFFSLSVLIVITLSCSKQTGTYQIQESKSWSLEIDNNLGIDTAMIALLRPYSDSLNKTMGKVISYSEQRMSKGFPEGLLGNFMTDLISNYAKNTLHLNFDFCLQNNGGFRADLPAGPVTIKHAYEIMPFDNELVVLEIAPQTMKSLLSYISLGEAVSVSGIRIVIHKGKENEAFINDLPIDTSKTYFMATSDYLANGGSGMSFLAGCKKINEPKIKIRDLEIAAMEQKYTANQHLNSKLDGRIKVME